VLYKELAKSVRGRWLRNAATQGASRSQQVG